MKANTFLWLSSYNTVICFRFPCGSCHCCILSYCQCIRHTSHNQRHFLLAWASPFLSLCACSVTCTISIRQAHGRHEWPRGGGSYSGRETPTGPRAEGEGRTGTPRTGREREVSWFLKCMQRQNGDYATPVSCGKFLNYVIVSFSCQLSQNLYKRF